MQNIFFLFLMTNLHANVYVQSSNPFIVHSPQSEKRNENFLCWLIKYANKQLIWAQQSGLFCAGHAATCVDLNNGNWSVNWYLQHRPAVIMDRNKRWKWTPGDSWAPGAPGYYEYLSWHKFMFSLIPVWFLSCLTNWLIF